MKSAAAAQLIQQQGKQRDGGGVVEQAFPGHQGGEPLRRAEVFEQPDNHAGIGGGDDRPQQQPDGQRRRLAVGQADRNAEQHPTDEQRTDHDRHHGHGQNGPNLIQQQANIDAQTGGEQQRRQENRQKGVRAQSQDKQPAQHIGAQIAADAEVGDQERIETFRREPDRQSQKRQQQRQGQTQPFRQGHHETDAQQNGRDRQ